MHVMRRLKQYVPLILAVALVQLAAQAQQPGGLRPGVKAPAFSLHDQSGKKQDLASLSGPNGLLLLFFRSADWCPFCKGQLVDLEGAQKAFAAKGIAVAAVSYDSPAILADFTKRRGITYPLLSDTSSSLIDKFGIRNTAATGLEVGIPYPGYYLIDPQGIIKDRFFETAYINRLTANNLYSNLFGQLPLPVPPRQLEATPHVTITASQSDTDVAPGAVVRLVVDLTPGPDTHVYAPGAEKQQYHVVKLTIAPSALYETTNTSYPKSELLDFPALHETVPVYTGSVALSTSLATNVSRDTIPIFAHTPHLDIKGEIEYQACTTEVCFPPVKAPVEWSLNIRPLDTERVPDNLQHK